MPMRPAIARPLYDKTRALPRMSWHPSNLYNIWQRSSEGPKALESSFTKGSMTLFQQRWRSKRLSRGYHGDHIGNTKFERWYLPESLPTIESNVESLAPYTAVKKLGNTVAGRQRQGGRLDDEKVRLAREKDGRAPVGTLMFREVERRLDVLIFRACFSSSVWQARQMVVHGKVKVNGKVIDNPNVRLNPGDLFQVDPSAIPMLQRPSPTASTETEEETKSTSEESSEKPTSETSATAESPSSSSSPETEPSSSSLPSSSETSESEYTSKPKPPKTSTKDNQPEPEPLAFFTLPPYAAPHLFIPAYLEPSFITCSAVYVRHPTARAGYSEIPSPYDADGQVMSLTWEWFKKRAPNMKGRRDRWMDPARTNDRKAW